MGLFHLAISRRLPALALIVLACPAGASLNAADSAADAAYDSGWTDGSNGGFGFQPWQLGTLGNAGWFLGDSNANGSGGGPGINSAGRAWGMYSRTSGSIVDAARPFTGALDDGQTFSMDLDNGKMTTDLGNEGQFDLDLIHGGGSNQFRFMAYGSKYYIYDGSQTSTVIPFSLTDGGMHLSFTKTGQFTYTFSLTRLSDSATYSHSGTILGSIGVDNGDGPVFDDVVDEIDMFSFRNGTDATYDGFGNNMSIVPEPVSLSVLGIGSLLVMKRRRRSSDSA